MSSGRSGDRFFLGMDAETAPDKLAQGMVQRARNTRFRTRTARTRPGIREIGWFYPDFYPYDTVVVSGGTGGSLSGVTYEDGSDPPIASATLNSTSSSFAAIYVGSYVRFATGRVLRITAYTSPTEVTVTDEAYYDADAVGDFVITTKNGVPSTVIQDDMTANSTEVRGGGLFSDPNGREYICAVTDDKMWMCREYSRPFYVTHGGITDDDSCFLLQCFDKMLLFRGEGKTVLEWDGSAYTNFQEITASSVGDYTDPIPNAKRGTFFQNRVWVGFDRDRIAVSDIGQYTRYDYLANEFRLNERTSDEIQSLFPYGKNALLVFFRNSIYLLDNIYGDLSAMRARRISRNIGCGNPDTIVNVADDVWFCDQNGDVWGISQVDDDRMELRGRPVSWPIRPYMDELGAQQVQYWKAAYHDSYFYLAFTRGIGGLVGTADAVAVFDTITERWAGIDWDDDTGYPTVDFWVQTDALNDRRLLCHYAGSFQIYGYGNADMASNRERSIRTEIETRAVGVKEQTRLITHNVFANIHTLNPRLTLTLVADGAGEEIPVRTAMTKDRTKYSTWGKSDYAVDNSGDNYADPHREDYQVLGDDDIVLPINGVRINPLQEQHVLEPLRFTGGNFSLRIDNNWYIDPENIGGEETLIELSDWSIRSRDRGEGQHDET